MANALAFSEIIILTEMLFYEIHEVFHKRISVDTAIVVSGYPLPPPSTSPRECGKVKKDNLVVDVS